ncbi:MAG: CoA-binding protein [bacterium]|nr:CoA-binding protein [bacterium]
MKFSDLDAVFRPKSAALIGASRDSRKWGFKIGLNVIAEKFRGDFYLVNPRETEFLSRRVYPSVLDIPGPVELAIIVIPAPLVPPVLKECGKKGVKAAVVITSGFSEFSPEGGKLETEITRIANDHGIILVGPNTMGIYSSDVKLHALMVPVAPLPGKISFVSQSGNLGVQLLTESLAHEVGFQKFVSNGNEAMLHSEYYLEYFGDDPETRTIMVYLEGFKNPTRFLEIARRVSRKKPIVLLKGGKTDSGARAALSHTGAMRSAREISSAIFRQAGIIEVDDTTELLDVAKGFERLPLPRGPNVGIITGGGGWGVITTDACELHGLRVPPLSAGLTGELRKIMPDFWPGGNPIDLVATVKSPVVQASIKKLAAEPYIDAVIGLGVANRARALTEIPEAVARTMPPEMLREKTRAMEEGDRQLAELVRDLIEHHRKPIIAVSIYRTGSKDREISPIVTYPTPERAVRVLARMYQYRQLQQKKD